MKDGKSMCIDNEIGSSTSRLSVRKGGRLKCICVAPLRRPEPPPMPRNPFHTFLRMEFPPSSRKQLRAKDPDGSIFLPPVQAAQAKWKTMSDAEKAPYVEISMKNRRDYWKNTFEYVQKRHLYVGQLTAAAKEDAKEEEGLSTLMGGLDIRQ